MNLISAGRGPRALPHLLLAGVFALSLAGCNTDEIVKVEDPAQLKPEATNSVEAVPALVNGAIRQFEGGYSGFGDDAFISSSGVISDELAWGDSFTTRFAADRRILQAPRLGNISDAAFLRLHQARNLALRASALIDKFETELVGLADERGDPEGQPDELRSLLRTTEGYVHVTLSEGWCSAVPFSDVPAEGEIDPTRITFGAPQSTTQMNQAAIALFDESIALDAADGDVSAEGTLAMVGKARALLNLGLYAEAEAAVAGVSDDFVFFLEHSTNTSAQNNGLASLIDNGRYAISNLEGGTTASGAALAPDKNTATSDATAEGLPFRAVQDPRLPYQLNGPCFTRSRTCWQDNNYPAFTSDVPLASGVEARLVEAEAALQRGDAVTMMAKLNGIRAQAAALLRVLYPEQRQVFPAPPTPPALAPLVDPVTPDARRDLLFKERALWLYGTGHRQGDLRRLIRNYGLLQSQVFPTGPYFRAAGTNFGTDVAFSVPFNEENNPEFDPALCVTSGA